MSVTLGLPRVLRIPTGLLAWSTSIRMARAINLTEGILRARYRDSLEFPKPIERDAVYEYHINLRATSNAFLPGHRLRVDVQSSSYPHWDRNPNTGQPFGESTISDVETATQTVFHDAARPSHITLPVVAALVRKDPCRCGAPNP